MPKTHSKSPQGITISPLAFVVGYMSIGAVGYFGVILFLALHLAFKFGLDAVRIGMIVGGITLLGALFSWAGGAVADRFSTYKVLRVTALLYAASATTMALANSLELFMLAVLVFALTRTVSSPASKAIFAQADDATGGAFRIRFIVLSLSFLCVALFSLLMPSEQLEGMFGFAALIFLLAFIWCVVFRFEGEARGKPPIGNSSHADIINAGAHRRAIVFVIAMGFFLFIIIGQLDTVLPLLLVKSFSEEGSWIYRHQLIIAGVCAFIFGIANHQIRARRSGLKGSRVVLLAFVLQFAGLIFLFSAPRASWVYAGAVIFSASEAILIPMVDGLASPLTRSHNRGRIMGILEIRQLAFFVGPAMGGRLLDHHQAWLLPVLLLTSVLMLAAYFLAKNASARITLADENATPPLTSLH